MKSSKLIQSPLIQCEHQTHHEIARPNQSTISPPVLVHQPPRDGLPCLQPGCLHFLCLLILFSRTFNGYPHRTRAIENDRPDDHPTGYLVIACLPSLEPAHPWARDDTAGELLRSYKMLAHFGISSFTFCYEVSCRALFGSCISLSPLILSPSLTGRSVSITSLESMLSCTTVMRT